MILTEKQLRHLRQTNYICSRLTDKQCAELLALFGEEPEDEMPYIWDEKYIWHTIRKLAQY